MVRSSGVKSSAVAWYESSLVPHDTGTASPAAIAIRVQMGNNADYRLLGSASR